MWTILFDIDGTLIRTQGVGVGAMSQTIRELYGDVEVPPVSVHGRTDRGIVGEIFEKLNLPFEGEGILTGNVRRAAEIKLKHFGLSEYFLFGGYGDEHADRNDVAADAQMSASKFLGNRFDSKKIWVIGDTGNDVRCARSIGAYSLAVETGGESSELLTSSKPNMQLRDLEDAEAWLSSLSLS